MLEMEKSFNILYDIQEIIDQDFNTLNCIKSLLCIYDLHFHNLMLYRDILPKIGVENCRNILHELADIYNREDILGHLRALIQRYETKFKILWDLWETLEGDEEI